MNQASKQPRSSRHVPATESVQRILISQSAWQLIQEETRQAFDRRIECGGSLMGAKQDNNVHVVYALRTGRDARQSYSGVTTDADYQQRLMTAILQQYPHSQLCYLGDYHLHPMYYPELSVTDHQTAAAILADAEHQDMQELVLILITYRHEQPEWHGFIARRGSSSFESVQVYSVPMETIDDAKCESLINDRYLPIDLIEQIKGESASFGAFGRQFHSQKEGQQRLQWDRQQIEDQFHLSFIEKLTDHDTLIWQFPLLNSGFEIAILFPPEYPLNIPTLMYRRIQTPEGDWELFQSQQNWNSFHSVADLVKEFDDYQSTQLQEKPDQPDQSDQPELDPYPSQGGIDVDEFGQDAQDVPWF